MRAFSLSRWGRDGCFFCCPVSKAFWFCLRWFVQLLFQRNYSLHKLAVANQGLFLRMATCLRLQAILRNGLFAACKAGTQMPFLGSARLEIAPNAMQRSTLPRAISGDPQRAVFGNIPISGESLERLAQVDGLCPIIVSTELFFASLRSGKLGTFWRTAACL